MFFWFLTALAQYGRILQWVENTLPLSQYLVGRTGRESSSAHRRYRPADLISYQCRRKLKDAGEDGREVVFGEICDGFLPVMRHFFLEKFPRVSEWYERRQCYTRSVATNSIVGYIIGLGDRHGANILIDLESAEVIHIDLGIAFEQGKYEYPLVYLGRCR